MSTQMRAPELSVEKNTDISIATSSFAWTRPEEIAKDLYIAAAIYNRDAKSAKKEVLDDLPLLTEMTVKQLQGWGYEREGPAELEIPGGQYFVKNRIHKGSHIQSRIIVLPEGRTQWGVSIAPLDDLSGIDLRMGLLQVKDQLSKKFDDVAQRFRNVGERAEMQQLSYAILRSTQSYTLACEITRSDPFYTMTIVDGLVKITHPQA